MSPHLMEIRMAKRHISKAKTIDDIQVTNDFLTSRAGLNPFVRYLRRIDMLSHLDRIFGSMRKHPKGTPIDDIFKQVLCFLFDGTSPSPSPLRCIDQRLRICNRHRNGHQRNGLFTYRQAVLPGLLRTAELPVPPIAAPTLPLAAQLDQAGSDRTKHLTCP